MKSWQLRLGLILVILSALTYLAYYLIFNNLSTAIPPMLLTLRFLQQHCSQVYWTEN